MPCPDAGECTWAASPETKQRPTRIAGTARCWMVKLDAQVPRSCQQADAVAPIPLSGVPVTEQPAPADLPLLALLHRASRSFSDALLERLARSG